MGTLPPCVPPRRDWFGQLVMDDVETTVECFASGEIVPAGAVYLSTVAVPNTSALTPHILHYFRLPAPPVHPVERAA